MPDEPLNVWFQRDTAPIWDRYLVNNAAWSKLPSHRPLRYLEIGVAAGDSMEYAFENLRIERAFGIDPYIAPKRRMQAKYDDYRLAAARRLAKYDPKVVLVYESSQVWLAASVAAGGEDSSFDFEYIDGDHNGPEALTDMILAWRLLRVGGIMAVDDIHRRWARGRSSVREAWRAFCDVYEDGYEFVYREPHQAAVRKIRP